MKSILILLFFLSLIGSAKAQEDRYFNSRASLSAHTKQVKIRHQRKHYAQRKHHHRVSVPAVAAYRGETSTALDPVQWVTKRVARVAGEVLGGRPSGCPHAYCGCWLGRHLGLLSRNLWLARNWAHVGAPANRAIGSVVVWSHHVGIVTDISANKIKVLSGNDGHRVRNRWRSGGGVIAYRRV